MKPYFITATGTGIGKTLITSALAYQLRAQSKNVRAVKPVISGFDTSHIEESDTGTLLVAQGLPLSQDNIDAISPWRFAAPLSPDLAAEDEGKIIDFNRLVAFCKQRKDTDVLLVEGIGGVMVPLGTHHTVLDWMLELGFPVILVAGSYLGSLNHTLLSAKAILAASLTLHAVVVSESESPAVPFARMRAALCRFLPPETLLIHIPRLDSSAELWKYVPNLMECI